MTGQRPLRVLLVRQEPRLGTVAAARLLVPRGGPPVAVVVSVTEAAELRLYRTGSSEPLWRDGERRLGGAPDLVRTGAAELFCLAPGACLLRVALQGDGVRCEEVTSHYGLPERLFAADDAIFGLYRSEDSGLTVARLRRAGPGELAAGERLPLPPMDAASTVSGVTIDRAGRIVLTSDHAVTGFKLWRQADAGGWTLLIADGAARFGANAAVHDIAAWGELVVLTVGWSRPVLDRLFGLRFPGEIVVLRPDGSHAMLCGETRTSRSGMMAPLAGQANAAARERGLFTRLARDGETLLVAMQRSADACIYRIGPAFEVSAESEVEGIVSDLAASEEVDAPLTALTLGSD